MPAKLLEHPPQWESWKDWISSDIRKRVTHCGGNCAEINNTDIMHFDKGYAVGKTMHQTVREFFLGPHNAVASSPFKAVTHEEAARTMIWKTCISYLMLHLAELNESYSDDHEILHEGMEGPDQDKTPSNSTSRSTIATTQIPPLLLPYWNAVQNCPPSEKLCLPKRLANFSMVDGNVQQYMNRLLRVAAEKGYLVAVGNLLAAGADCNCVDNHKGTPLLSAMMNGPDATAWLLVDSSAHKDIKDGQGRTALHIAASNGHISGVQLLIKTLSADIKARDYNGAKALHHATSKGHNSTVTLLVEIFGADIEAKDYEGLTAWRYADRNGHNTTVQLCETTIVNMKAVLVQSQRMSLRGETGPFTESHPQ
ncbi:ankyrin repeat-containing domain protein [Trichophaea hybrida]|nr:ankyrin repeat-containing domain protein [Trichophaea hybrida]